MKQDEKRQEFAGSNEKANIGEGMCPLCGHRKDNSTSGAGVVLAIGAGALSWGVCVNQGYGWGLIVLGAIFLGVLGLYLGEDYSRRQP